MLEGEQNNRQTGRVPSDAILSSSVQERWQVGRQTRKSDHRLWIGTSRSEENCISDMTNSLRILEHVIGFLP